MTGPLSGGNARVAVVTGGASGIGRASAQCLAARGIAVAIADQDAVGSEALAVELRRLGHEASAHEMDVRDPEDCERLVHEVVARWHRLDILVHSAGVGMERSFLETTSKEWERLIGINLTGTFNVCQAAARAMVKANYGRIVLLSSAAGLRGGTGRAAYGASKGGILSLCKVMAVELAAHGITVNSLAPGAIETELVARMHDADTRQAYTAGIPMKRYGTPQEVADAAAFLASEEASYITGHTLCVDGGFASAGVMKTRSIHDATA